VGASCLSGAISGTPSVVLRRAGAVETGCTDLHRSPRDISSLIVSFRLTLSSTASRTDPANQWHLIVSNQSRPGARQGNA
jgi:hypothetical protein